MDKDQVYKDAGASENPYDAGRVARTAYDLIDRLAQDGDQEASLYKRQMSVQGLRQDINAWRKRREMAQLPYNSKLLIPATISRGLTKQTPQGILHQQTLFISRPWPEVWQCLEEFRLQIETLGLKYEVLNLPLVRLLKKYPQSASPAAALLLEGCSFEEWAERSA